MHISFFFFLGANELTFSVSLLHWLGPAQVTFYSAFKGGRELLPFDSTKQTQFKNALIKYLKARLGIVTYRTSDIATSLAKQMTAVSVSG
jgi:hypothetical protein